MYEWSAFWLQNDLLDEERFEYIKRLVWIERLEWIQAFTDEHIFFSKLRWQLYCFLNSTLEQFSFLSFRYMPKKTLRLTHSIRFILSACRIGSLWVIMSWIHISSMSLTDTLAHIANGHQFRPISLFFFFSFSCNFSWFECMIGAPL